MNELDVLKSIDELLDTLDEAARIRSIDWLVNKYLRGRSPSGATPVQMHSGAAHQPLRAMTAKAVATELKAETGPDLLYAAVACLAAVQAHEELTRAALLDTMKSAAGFYKQSDVRNLSKYLDGLCKKGVLIEVRKDTYTVKAQALAEMTAKLAL